MYLVSGWWESVVCIGGCYNNYIDVVFINTGYVYGILCSEECYIGNGFIVSCNMMFVNISMSNNLFIIGFYYFF